MITISLPFSLIRFINLFERKYFDIRSDELAAIFKPDQEWVCPLEITSLQIFHIQLSNYQRSLVSEPFYKISLHSG